MIPPWRIFINHRPLWFQHGRSPPITDLCDSTTVNLHQSQTSMIPPWRIFTNRRLLWLNHGGFPPITDLKWFQHGGSPPITDLHDRQRRDMTDGDDGCLHEQGEDRWAKLVTHAMLAGTHARTSYHNYNNMQLYTHISILCRLWSCGLGLIGDH